MEHLGENFIFAGLGLTVGLGELRAQRGDRGRERRVLAGKARRADIALGLVEVASGEASYLAPEAHWDKQPYEREGLKTIGERVKFWTGPGVFGSTAAGPSQM
jgi:hypothetical protein